MCWCFKGRLKKRHQLDGHTGWITCIEITDTMVITGSKDCTVKMWDLASGDLLQSLSQDAEITCLSTFSLRQVCTQKNIFSAKPFFKIECYNLLQRPSVRRKVHITHRENRFPNSKMLQRTISTSVISTKSHQFGILYL